MTKPKLVCVIGSVALTAFLLYAMLFGLVVVLALAIGFGWIPEPPAHNPGGILNAFFDSLAGIALLVLAIDTGRWLFRQCYRQPDRP
jgi:hypothetical protein